VTRLEAELKAHYGQGREAILTASATAGLTAVLMAHGLHGPVILPAFTFPATAQAVLAAGCFPVLCDVHPDTWELDPADLARIVRNRGLPPVAIVHVRAFGLDRDLDAIVHVADPRSIPLIVDAAAALGSTRPADPRITAEVFSLHATKPFGIGEGGLILTDRRLAERIRQTINFGMKDHVPVGSGMNGKMSEFQAAVGLAQHRRIDAHLARRRAIAHRYQDAGIPAPPGQYDAPWQTYPVLADDPEAAIRRLAAAGIETRRYYRPALHLSPRFHDDDPMPVSEYLAEHMICLPVYSDMTDREQTRVLQAWRAAQSNSAPNPVPS